MIAFYAGLNGFRARSELRTRVVDGRGLPLPNSSALPQVREVIAQRPNRFAVRPESPSLTSVVSDGRQLSALLPTRSRYLSLTAPVTFAELVADAELEELIGASPTQIIPFHLLSDDSGPRLAGLVTTSRDAILESVDGAASRRLTFAGEGTLAWDLWVAAEGDPLLLRASVNRGTLTRKLPGRGETEITIHVTETLHDWELNPNLTDDDFTIAIPESAVRARNVSEFRADDEE
jgi:hypothetical protein